MLNYKQARIYTVRCRRNHMWIYVGSTTRPLSRRFSAHKTQKTCALYKFVHEHCGGDWSDWYIELYEQNGYNNKEELNKREGQIMREISTINKNIAGRTIKEYYNDNKEHIKRQVRQRNDNNKFKQFLNKFIIHTIILNSLYVSISM